MAFVLGRLLGQLPTVLPLPGALSSSVSFAFVVALDDLALLRVLVSSALALPLPLLLS